MKIDTCHVDHLTWQTPEWADEGSEALVAYHAGYELEIGPSGERANKWDWLCKMTAAISEPPELVACGTAASVSGAKRGAGTAANDDMRRRAKAAQEAPVKPEPGPETDTPTGAEMLAGTEKAVEQAMNAKGAKAKRTRKQAEHRELAAA